MNRRQFIRVAGGGVILAAVGTNTGCSSAYPPAALAPWKGPDANADLRRWALSYAILAPSSHNLQPWLVDLSHADTIVLHVDRERLLPMTDPWFRQIMVSQGTFLEALALALRQRGMQVDVALFPEGEFAPRTVDARPVARVSWKPGGRPDPLFDQIPRRHTAKVAYDTTRPVEPATLAMLLSGSGMEKVRLAGTIDMGRVAALRQLCLDASKVEIETPRTMMESVRLSRVGPAEIEQHRDGISLNGWLPRLAARVGLFDRENPPAPGSTAWKQAMALVEEHSLSAMGFVWMSTGTALHRRSGTERSAEVEAGRAYMRLHLKASALGLQMHPMSQAPQEFAEMRPHYEKLHQDLLGRTAEEETVQMFCRIGYCADQQHAPRRGVDAIIRA